MTTLEKNTKLAQGIEILKMHLSAFGIDDAYIANLVAELHTHASRYDTMAPLNRNYDPDVGSLLSEQARAMGHLCDFITSLKACQQWKDKVAANKKHQKDMDSLFNMLNE